jgi:hypothetical protein
MYTTDKIVFTVDSFSQFVSLVHCVLIIEKILPTFAKKKRTKEYLHTIKDR